MSTEPRPEVPRLVKKPGEYKRVENLQELDAALADGWVLRLEPGAVAPVEPLLVDEVDADIASVLTADLERQDAELEEDPEPTEGPSEPAKRKPGRPRKS